MKCGQIKFYMCYKFTDGIGRMPSMQLDCFCLFCCQSVFIIGLSLRWQPINTLLHFHFRWNNIRSRQLIKFPLHSNQCQTLGNSSSMKTDISGRCYVDVTSIHVWSVWNFFKCHQFELYTMAVNTDLNLISSIWYKFSWWIQSCNDLNCSLNSSWNWI